MLPKTHIILGAIFSLLAWLLFPSVGLLGFGIIFLSSVLIDVDHYLYYVHKKKNWSLKRAYDWFFEKRDTWLKSSKKEKEKFEVAIIIFHGIECWILIVLLVFVHKIFLFMLVGIIIHMIFDIIDLYLNNAPIHYKLSQLYMHKKNKKRLELI